MIKIINNLSSIFFNSKIDNKMNAPNKIYSLITILIILLSGSRISIAQQSNNNAFMFNGVSSELYIYDGQPANSDANQNGFGFFNSNASNNQITIQVWIYLLSDTPPDVEIPIIYRTVNNGTT